VGNSKNYRFEWNFTPEEIANRKGFTREFYSKAGEILISYMRPYVPYDSGALDSYVRAYPANDHVTINYQRPYAKKQYYGTGGYSPGASNQPTAWNRNLSIHPLATSYWDKAAWTASGDFIVRDLNEVRKRLSK
jgi:hypothetical protein